MFSRKQNDIFYRGQIELIKKLFKSLATSVSREEIKTNKAFKREYRKIMHQLYLISELNESFDSSL